MNATVLQRAVLLALHVACGAGKRNVNTAGSGGASSDTSREGADPGHGQVTAGTIDAALEDESVAASWVDIGVIVVAWTSGGSDGRVSGT